MKATKIILAVVMTLALLVNFSLASFAAVETKAGSTVTVSFDIPEIYGVNGYFEYSNLDLFSDVSYVNDSEFAGEVSNDRVYLYGVEEQSIQISIEVTVQADAAPGDSCDITLNYETSDINGSMSEWKTITQTVVIREVTPPETGDTAMVVFSAIALFSLAAVYVAFTKKRRNYYSL